MWSNYFWLPTAGYINQMITRTIMPIHGVAMSSNANFGLNGDFPHYGSGPQFKKGGGILVVRNSSKWKQRFNCNSVGSQISNIKMIYYE